MTSRRGVSLLLAALLTLSGAAAARAATHIEGEYQLMSDTRKSQREFPWNWDSNNNDEWTGAQIRLFSQPRPGVEGFMKIESDWNSDNNNTTRPVFQFREAHLRYRWAAPKSGIDSYLFSRQDRFWVDNYLIRVVDGGRLKDDNNGPNAQGIRVDTWGFGGINSSFIVSDFSSQFNPTKAAGTADRGAPNKTDDVFIARFRREQLKDKALRLGLTFTRKDENQINEIVEDAVVRAGDARYRWRGTDFSLEYAESSTPITRLKYADQLERKVSIFRHATFVHLPSRGVLVGEIRSLRLGTARSGYINVTPTYWSRGPLYDNRTGDSNSDETGFILNSYYLLPERAVTFTNNYIRYSRRAFEKRDDTEFYSEMYIEFVNGFTGKSYLREHSTYRGIAGVQTKETHNDWFGEVQVESKLAWMRLQSLIKDLSTPTRKQLFSLENSVNVTGKLKVYNRFAFANDPAILRKGIFTQLQYRPTGNMEMFLEYGPGWIADDSTPVNDGDLQGSGDQTDLVKFILKGTF